MKKLLLLATGGTIASVQGEQGLAPGMGADDLLGFCEGEQADCRIDTLQLMNIDSTNMQPELWVDMAKAIYDNYDRYDGFVVTHGTDTMAYTSAALSYMLQNGPKPIVITGSQVPIHFRDSDATLNVKDAIRFACEDIGGVYVVFDGKVIRGTRAMKMRTKSRDAFESVNHPYIAFISGPNVEYVGSVPPASGGTLACDTSLSPDVFVLKLVPGTKPELFDYLKTLYKGVVIESFGNGGIPMQGRDLLPKIDELLASGVAVVMTTQCLWEGENLNLYEVGRKMNQALIIRAGDMNTEAVVAKLMWALGRTSRLHEIKTIMERPVQDDRTV